MKIVQEGVWCNSDMIKRTVRITIEENHTYENRKLFAVWYETDIEQFGVNGGYYDSEYAAMDSAEKIIGQKVKWSSAAT